MKIELKAVIALYVFCFLTIAALLLVVFYIRETSNYPVDWTTSAVNTLLSILQLSVGAVVGALSAAFATYFPSAGDKPKPEKTD